MSEEIRVALADLTEGSAVRVEGGPSGVCLVMLEGKVHALADRCSHQDWPLSDGEVYASERSIECTKHGSTFSVDDGRPFCLPATRPVP
ncbi:MAG TPA: Rieske 2Fe-2S domain-containing protein, partial [Acidimicrobiales bacterium]|nr:Rieske 2Fe-2S domain-containing protein [Acidimicrobiales bacterium]